MIAINICAIFAPMENKKNNRKFITTKEAVISAIVLLVILAINRAPNQMKDIPESYRTRDVSETEVDLYLGQIKEITASSIANKINAPDNKPTLMVFYTSWCPYCKILMPNIIDLKSNGKLDDMNLIFLSVDKDKNKLSTYILQHNYDKHFTPYIILPDEEQKLKNIIVNKGAHYTRAIPYSLFFDKRGNLVEENVGMMDKKTILVKSHIASGSSTQ